MVHHNLMCDAHRAGKLWMVVGRWFEWLVCYDYTGQTTNQAKQPQLPSHVYGSETP